MSTNEIIPYSTMESMAKTIAESGLWGIKRPVEALSLMMVAQAEGRHPAIVARDYHIISGRPALRADAIMARFQEAGGRVTWLHLDDEKAEAKFSHPQGEATISWDLARAKRAQITGNGMWAKYPRQMLRSRVVSEGVRTVLPGCVCGVYEVEETKDMVAQERPVSARVVEENLPALPAAPSAKAHHAANPVVEVEAKKVDAVAPSANPVSAACAGIDKATAAEMEQARHELRDCISLVPADMLAELKAGPTGSRLREIVRGVLHAKEMMAGGAAHDDAPIAQVPADVAQGGDFA